MYIFKEPDVSGETFIRKVCEALSKMKFEGNVYSLHLLDAKDPSELHLKTRLFKDRWQATMAIAEKVNISQAAGQIENVMPRRSCSAQAGS